MTYQKVILKLKFHHNNKTKCYGRNSIDLTPNKFISYKYITMNCNFEIVD
jgi:hypothetical protein